MEEFQKKIDPSIFITLRKYDWRDAHDEKMIIWSLESQHHPEFGKVYAKGKNSKTSLRYRPLFLTNGIL